MFITVAKKISPEKTAAKSKKKGTQKNTVKEMFESIGSSQTSSKHMDDDVIEVGDIPEFNKIPDTFSLWSKTKG